MLNRILSRPAIALTSLLLAAPAYATTSLDCLTEAIYFEAGMKGENGRRAVAHTILNRVRHREFPNNVCGVIAQGEASGKCQFSYRCDGKAEVYVYQSQLNRAYRTARNVLNGKSDDLTGGAIFFHADSIPPGWFATRKRVGNFGGNIFYR